jgi:hypothetical protein
MHVVLLVLFSPLIAALILLVLPIIAFLAVRVRVRTTLFCLRFHGTTFLVSGRNRGWYDFVRNNVANVLPQPMTLLWYRAGGPRAGHRRHRLLELLLYRGPIGTKPLVVQVRRFGLTVIPVHDELVKLKARSVRRDAAIADESRAILERAAA